MALCAVETADAVAMKPALVAPLETVTDAGTVTAPLLLDKLTTSPPLPAAALRSTVHPSLPGPLTELSLQDSELSVGAVEPVETAAEPLPCNLTFSDGLELELLETVNCPVESPLAFGLNCTSTL